MKRAIVFVAMLFANAWDNASYTGIWGYCGVCLFEPVGWLNGSILTVTLRGGLCTN